MIELTLWEQDFPSIFVHRDSIAGFAALKVRPHWSEGGLNNVSRLYLTHVPREIIVSQSVERIRELIVLDDPIDKPGFNPHIPCLHCNDIHLGAELHHKHDPKEGVGYIRLIAIGGRYEYCFRCRCIKSGFVNMPNIIEDWCANHECLCHTAERCK